MREVSVMSLKQTKEFTKQVVEDVLAIYPEKAKKDRSKHLSVKDDACEGCAVKSNSKTVPGVMTARGCAYAGAKGVVWGPVKDVVHISHGPVGCGYYSWGNRRNLAEGEIGVDNFNTLEEQVGAKIYSYVRWEGQTLIGPEASRLLISKQLEGLSLASKAGMTIKINTVLIPGVNDQLLYSLGLEIKKRGANIHNIMPMIPQGKLAHIAAPTPELISDCRESCGEILPQMKHCQQCRADAIGLL